MPTLKQLTKKHATYILECDRWTLLEKLVAGGKKVDLETKKSLLQNPDGRPANIIEARAKLAPYVNILGSALQRVVAQLFQEPANFEGSKDGFWIDWLDSKAFVLDGDDDSKASFTLGLKKAAMMSFTNGKAIAEISTKYSGEATNLKQQRELGELDPYVVILPQSAMWDWDVDASGFRYVKICRYRLEKQSWTDPDVPIYSFTIYERSPQGKVVVSQYEIRPKPENEQYKANPASFKLETAKEDDVIISPVEVGGVRYENVEIFNLNGKFDFPIKTLTFPPELCIGDQLMDLCIEFFRLKAGIAWKLQSVNFSMPVVEMPSTVESADELLGKQKFGDGYYLAVPNGTKVTTLDMGSGSIPISVNYLDKIAESFMSLLHQISTSAASSNSGLGRSADKTREDKKLEVSMLEVTGMEVALFADSILDCCAIARNENIDWTVDGFNNYLGEGLDEMLNDIERMLKNAINTPTLRREEINKTSTAFCKKYKVSDKAKAMIADEIAALPDETLNKPMALPFPPSPPQEQNNGNGQNLGADLQQAAGA